MLLKQCNSCLRGNHKLECLNSIEMMFECHTDRSHVQMTYAAILTSEKAFTECRSLLQYLLLVEFYSNSTIWELGVKRAGYNNILNIFTSISGVRSSHRASWVAQ